MKLLHAALPAVLFAVQGAAIAVTPGAGLNGSLIEDGYPFVANPMVNPPSCFAESLGTTFDLSRICGYAPSSPVSIEGGSFVGGSSAGGGGGGVAGGPCNVPSDIAGDGRRCGGRAASERSGGR